MENIDSHIAKNKKILDDPQISSQARRHIEEELEELQSYKINYPDDQHDPSSLELYCNSYPDAIECKLYDN